MVASEFGYFVGFLSFVGVTNAFFGFDRIYRKSWSLFDGCSFGQG